MKQLAANLKALFTIKELKERAQSTFFFLLVFRLGSCIVLPGVDPTRLVSKAQGLFGLLDTLVGGAFSKASILAIGIMPYISASIVIQLLTLMIPRFQRMQKEGASGRNKLNQLTRRLTVVIGVMQALGFVLSTGLSLAELTVINKTTFIISSTVLLVAGSMFCVWLGERITDYGLGNGTSMLIMVGIVAALPRALYIELVAKGSNGLLFLLIEFVCLFFIMVGVVMFTQATRNIPIQYARQVTGNVLQMGQRQYIPLKLNAAGVMPIIFAQTLMFLPALVAGFWSKKSAIAVTINRVFSDYTTWQYSLVYGLMILLFTFFYTAITINPAQVAEDLKRNGGFVPGVKPGKPTATFIDNILNKITLPSALFLAAIAVLPAIAHLGGISKEFSRFYGGTALLIMVSVILDTIQQVQSYLLMHRYEGMVRAEGMTIKRG